MAFCTQCGTQFDDSGRFCPSCGREAAAPGAQPPAWEPPVMPGAQGAPSPARDVEDNKAMAVLAYIIFLVPLLAAKDSPFARYHTNQGLVLVLFGIAYSLVFGLLSPLLMAISFRLAMVLIPVLGIVCLTFPVFCIIGIVNACRGVERPLPLIGGIRILR